MSLTTQDVKNLLLASLLSDDTRELGGAIDAKLATAVDGIMRRVSNEIASATETMEDGLLRAVERASGRMKAAAPTMPAVIAMGTADREMGWIPAPHFFTATLEIAETRGDTSMTPDATATCRPPRAEKSWEKITATPPNPRRMPDSSSGFSGSEGSAKWARMVTKSG